MEPTNKRNSTNRQKMMKRGKKLHITIDSLPASLGNEKIMNGSSSGVNSRSITSLIGIGIAFRRRKNFSVILFVGLSALLCALYYTSYYPGAVWTVRLGVTSFGSHSGTATTALDGQRNAESLALTGSASGVNLNHGTTGNKTKSKEGKIFPSGFDGKSGGNNNDGGGTTSSNSQMISSSISNINWGLSSSRHGGKAGKSGSNPNNGKSNVHGGGGDGGETAEEISSPKTGSWKYWASLEYWKVNLTDTGASAEEDDDEVDEFSHSLSEKPAGGR